MFHAASAESISHLIVQHFILRFHASQECIFGKIVRSTLVLLVGALDLLVQCLDVWREEAVELECCSLIVGESGAFVELG